MHPSPHPAPQFLPAPPLAEGGEPHRIAYLKSGGDAPTLMWCGGLMSDMRGTKAGLFHDWAEARGLGFVRFDYLGHGESSGEFTQGTIGRWARDTVQVMDDLTTGPLILIGSSMGGWASLLAALSRPDRVQAMLLINPAPNFTEWMWESWSDAQRRAMKRDGVLNVPSDYDEPYVYTWDLIRDGREQTIIGDVIPLSIPVHIFSGNADTVVPTHTCEALATRLPKGELTVVRGGDHSLSRPQDMERMLAALEILAGCET